MANECWGVLLEMVGVQSLPGKAVFSDCMKYSLHLPNLFYTHLSHLISPETHTLVVDSFVFSQSLACKVRLSGVLAHPLQSLDAVGSLPYSTTVLSHLHRMVHSSSDILSTTA